MSRRVRFHDDFRRDLRAQLEWLADREEWERIDRLRSGIGEAVELVAEFPEAGVLVARRRSGALRKLLLRRVPFVVWFAVEPPKVRGDIWLLRLFHVRQERPHPRRGLRSVGRKR